MNSTIPHVRVVIGFCLLAAFAYLGFSVWVFSWTDEAALRGDSISFDIAAGLFGSHHEVEWDGRRNRRHSPLAALTTAAAICSCSLRRSLDPSPIVTT